MQKRSSLNRFETCFGGGGGLSLGARWRTRKSLQPENGARVRLKFPNLRVQKNVRTLSVPAIFSGWLTTSSAQHDQHYCRLHVLKGIPQLVIPSSQGWGVRSFHLDSTRFFFFLAPFCLLLFCFCTSSRKEHDQPRLMAM